MELDDKKYFFFDLDKTLWNWDENIIAAEELVNGLVKEGKKVFYITDNTLLSNEDLVRKLNKQNFPASKDSVLTSGEVIANYLDRKDVREAYVIGESGLIDEFGQRDIRISRNADKVVLGFDRKFNYDKIERGMKILENGGDLYVASTESTFRTDTETLPHQKPMNNALSEYAEPENFGKPSEHFRDALREKFSYLPGMSVFIGDRFADFETGNRLGMTTAAVLSGDVSRDDLNHIEEDFRKPDFGMSSLNKLKKKILR